MMLLDVDEGKNQDFVEILLPSSESKALLNLPPSILAAVESCRSCICFGTRFLDRPFRPRLALIQVW